MITNVHHNFVALNDNLFSIKLKGNFSIKWAGTAEKNYSTFDHTYLGLFSENAVETLHHVKNTKGFSINVMLADVYGHIAFAPSGSLPVRKSQKLGNRICRGWTDENEWLGFVEPDQKPYILDPIKGFIVAANNPITSHNVKFPVSVYSPHTARSYRITGMIQEALKRTSNKFSLEDSIKILSDVKDLYAEAKINYMTHAVYSHLHENTEMHKHNTVALQKYLNMIKLWNKEYHADLIEPTYFTFWEYTIQKHLFLDQIPDQKAKMEFLSHPLGDRFLINFFRELSKNAYYK